VGAAWLAADERLQLAKTEEWAAAVQLISPTEESESEIQPTSTIKCPRNRGAFRGGRKIGGGGIAPMRQSIGPGDRIVGQCDWQWRAHLFTWAPERVAGSVFLMPLNSANLWRVSRFVQGIIAGGAPALRRSIEGAEDDARSGALAMDERRVTREDLVIGISASGRAAFVIGALRARRKSASANNFC